MNANQKRINLCFDLADEKQCRAYRLLQMAEKGCKTEMATKALISWVDSQMSAASQQQQPVKTVDTSGAWTKLMQVIQAMNTKSELEQALAGIGRIEKEIAKLGEQIKTAPVASVSALTNTTQPETEPEDTGDDMSDEAFDALMSMLG